MVKKVIKKLDRVLLGGSISATSKWHARKKIARQMDKLASGLGHKFAVHHKKNRLDVLAGLCDKHGSDKGEIKTSGHPYPWESHTYTDCYSRLFAHCRPHVKRVFECGLGTNNSNFGASMGADGKPGASLRVWRDYFPNAIVYGADIDRDILFAEERIKTFYIDQLDPMAISAFWGMVGAGDFDLMVDDGLHEFEAGTCLFTHSVQHLSQNGIYIIEDVGMSDLLRYAEFFSKMDYSVDYVTMFRQNVAVNGNNLIVIRRS